MLGAIKGGAQNLAHLEVPNGIETKVVDGLADGARELLQSLRSAVHSPHIDEAWGVGRPVEARRASEVLTARVRGELSGLAMAADEVAQGARLLGVQSDLGLYASGLKEAIRTNAPMTDVATAFKNVDFGLGHGHGGMANSISGDHVINPKLTHLLGETVHIPAKPTRVEAAVLQKFVDAAKAAQTAG
jgi:hypothetical protein